MSTYSTLERSGRTSKRAMLTEIVSRLGPESSPAQIREEAWRVGFGQVHPAMLRVVRNSLWPDRVRRSITRSWSAAGKVVYDDSAPKAPTCGSCGSDRTFAWGCYTRKDGSKRRSRKCRACGKITRAIGEIIEVGARRESRKRILARHATAKECTKCRRMLPVESFGFKAADSELRRPWCKECTNRIRRMNYGTRSITQLYGLLPEQYAAILERQRGLCAICGSPESGRRGERNYPLAVDHCHRTKKVRGLLCNKCNLGIGNFNDDIGRIESALHYLRQHESSVSGQSGEGVTHG